MVSRGRAAPRASCKCHSAPGPQRVPRRPDARRSGLAGRQVNAPSTIAALSTASFASAGRAPSAQRLSCASDTQSRSNGKGWSPPAAAIAASSQQIAILAWATCNCGFGLTWANPADALGRAIAPANVGGPGHSRRCAKRHPILVALAKPVRHRIGARGEDDLRGGRELVRLHALAQSRRQQLRRELLGGHGPPAVIGQIAGSGRGGGGLKQRQHGHDEHHPTPSPSTATLST